MDESRISSLLKLRPIIFGLSIFSLVWTWSDTVDRLAIYAGYEVSGVSPFWPYEQVLLASFLLLASLGLLLNRPWSQWASLIVSGRILYLLTIRSFWNLAHNAEVPLFSYDHVSLWYPNTYDGQLLHIVLSALIFSCEWCLKLKGFLGVLCVLSVLCVKW